MSVTYIRNNTDSGDVPEDATEYEPGATVTVAGNTGSLARTYYTYANWNTKADGTGLSYKAGDTIAIGSEDLTLYAAWFTEPAGFIYDDSSGTSVTITGYNYDDKITEVIIPPTIGGLPVTAIGRAFEVKTKMVSVLIPQSVTSIGNLAFAYCTALASVAIPSSVTYIGDNAFHYCQGLSSVLIEEGVSSIGNGMFSLCTYLPLQ